MKDYYEILGVGKNASQDEIKRAYRKLAHEHHPDKKGGDEKKFKEINEAYQILGDEQKRQQYDRFGKTFAGGGQSGFSGFFPPPPSPAYATVVSRFPIFSLNCSLYIDHYSFDFQHPQNDINMMEKYLGSRQVYCQL